jgi:AraC family transcriptional regulator
MRPSTSLDYQASIHVVIKQIFAKLDSPVSVQDLSEASGFSRFHFGRIFSAAMGEGLHEFIRRLRLERAGYQLRSSHDALTMIGHRAGFESSEAFTRAFKAAYLVTPSEFRRSKTRLDLRCLNGVHWAPAGWNGEVALMLAGENNMDIRIEEAPVYKVIAVRHSGPYYEIGSAFGKVFQWAGQNHVPIEGSIGIYYDDPGVTPPDQLTSDACVVVPQEYELPENTDPFVRLTTIGGGLHAIARHEGSYKGLTDAWAKFLGQAIPSTGKEIAYGPSFEVYVNDCSQVAEADLLTDLYQPVEAS